MRLLDFPDSIAPQIAVQFDKQQAPRREGGVRLAAAPGPDRDPRRRHPADRGCHQRPGREVQACPRRTAGR
ncbi:hypothetical protein G5V59_02475 [Nocardioides sp. W3-2-3]|uniref:hypothetical protein n=1 Tax=Nocardioides convexus TaxID=2712224 RepID=UPI0024189376|nr:hypothetical protein [Nocardioides convexus]NGZ99618.1 hypothetical protein [Nocardioides convexus]